MTLLEQNKGKAVLLLPNCQTRFMVAMDECFHRGFLFHIDQTFRTQDVQNSYYTQGRSLADIQSLYDSRVITKAQYDALKAIYDAGKNRNGEKVTWTLHSSHTQRRAVDLDPIIPIDRMGDTMFKKQRLTQIASVMAHYGVYRPAATVAVGDYRHFEVLDVPLPVDSPLYQRSEKRRRDRIDRAISPTPR